MFIDTHCHLFAAEFDADRDEVVERARAVGVGTMIVPAVDVGSFEPTRATGKYAGTYAAYGLHPVYCDRHQPEDLQTLRAWIERERPVAVGEIGLDFFVPGLDVQRQTWFFAEQLKLARDFDLPVILHVRRSQDQILKQLRRFRVRGGFAHAFNGSRQQADEFLKLGFCLGFGGTLSFERSLRIRELARTLPLDAIVLETDAPDMAPAFAIGQRNTPDTLPRIAAILAELRHETVGRIAQATSSNARATLGLPPLQPYQAPDPVPAP